MFYKCDLHISGMLPIRQHCSLGKRRMPSAAILFPSACCQNRREKAKATQGGQGAELGRSGISTPKGLPISDCL